MSLDQPPYYILVQHNPSSALIHPDIEYRYADDSPLTLLPRFPDEHVLVFTCDPANPANPTVSSTSSQLALSGLKISPAPGAHAEEDAAKNDNMYILQVASTASDDQTGGSVESSSAYLQNPRAIVARFKQRHVDAHSLVSFSSRRRNADLRRILEYPDTPAGDHASEPVPESR